MRSLSFPLHTACERDSQVLSLCQLQHSAHEKHSNALWHCEHSCISAAPSLPLHRLFPRWEVYSCSCKSSAWETPSKLFSFRKEQASSSLLLYLWAQAFWECVSALTHPPRKSSISVCQKPSDGGCRTPRDTYHSSPAAQGPSVSLTQGCMKLQVWPCPQWREGHRVFPALRAD